MTWWWWEWKKSCFDSTWCLTARRCIHLNVVLCTRLDPAVFVLSHFLSFFPSLLSFVLRSPCHYPGTNLFAAPETLNWLFIDTSCNWLLITVLHLVLIFKSVARRKGPLHRLAVSHRRCMEAPVSCVCAPGHLWRHESEDSLTFDIKILTWKINK